MTAATSTWSWAGPQPLTIEADLTHRTDFDSEPPITLRGTDNHLRGTLEGGGTALRIRADRSEVRLRSN